MQLFWMHKTKKEIENQRSTESERKGWRETEREIDWLKGKYIKYANLLYLQNNKISHTRNKKPFELKKQQ